MTLSAAGAPQPIVQFLPSIAAGRLDGALIRTLSGVERGKHRLLLEAARRASASSPRAAESARAFSVLIEAERCAPEIVADIVALPQVGGWAVEYLTPENDGTGGLSCRHHGYMCALAAVAAFRASITFDLNVPVCDGAVIFPGLGRLELPEGDTGRWVRLRSDGSGTLIATHDDGEWHFNPRSSTPIEEWVPVPHLHADSGGLSFDPLLDTEACLAAEFGRSKHTPPVSPDQWAAGLSEAWRVLAERHRATAEAIALAVRTLVPLPASEGHGTPSATSGWLWGAIALGPPPDPETFAEILVHEVNHLILAAIEDEVPLVLTEPADEMYAPWRDDPRPPTGVLHGAFANVALAEFWLVEARTRPADPQATLRAEVEFAWRRLATREATRELAESGTLTEAGRLFVAALGARLEDHRHVPISARASRLAEELTTEHRLRWRLGHLRPDHHAVDRLARAWTAGKKPPADPGWPRTWLRPGPPLGGHRHNLLGLRAHPPEVFAAALARHALAPSERALMLGDDATARRGLLATIAAGPAPDAWVGLGLLDLRAGGSPQGSPLLDRPETVMAVHERIRTLTGAPADPARLIHWMATRR